MPNATIRSLPDVDAYALRGLKLPTRATVDMPVVLAGRRQFERLCGEARRQAALPLLRAALADIQCGWCQGALEDGTGRVSLYGAIATGRVESEYAREVLREVLCEWNLVAWNDHPARRKAEVVAALKHAVARARRHLRSGGWQVSP